MSRKIKVALAGFLLLGSGCCAPGAEGGGDMSRIGGIIGVVIGFGLFFLAIFLSSRSSK